LIIMSWLKTVDGNRKYEKIKRIINLNMALLFVVKRIHSD